MRALFLATLLLACNFDPGCTGPTPGPNPPPGPTPPPVHVDAGPPPAPTPTPPPPTPGDKFDAMCANLAKLGCAEGSAANCATSARVGGTSFGGRSPLTYVPVDCLTKAATKSAARACGFVKCP